jgi:Mg2+ and Co2+ transporter CorA
MLKYLLASEKSFKKGSSLGFPLPKKDEFLFLYSTDSSEQEKKKLAETLSIEEHLFKSFPRASRSVAYSTTPLAFAFVDYFLDKGEVKHSRILFALKENVLLIVSPTPAHYSDLFERLCNQIQNAPKEKRSLYFLIHDFLHEDVEGNFDIIEALDAQIVKIEERVFDFQSSSAEDLKEIISLRRELAKMSRRFWSSAKLLSSLKREWSNAQNDVNVYNLLDDLYNSYLHQIEILSSQKELLADAVAIFEASLSNRLAVISLELNEVMKKLTALTVLIMLPTLIASIYGMNIFGLPFAQHPFALEISIILMLVAAIVTYYYFHKKQYI